MSREPSLEELFLSHYARRRRRRRRVSWRRRSRRGSRRAGGRGRGLVWGAGSACRSPSPRRATTPRSRPGITHEAGGLFGTNTGIAALLGPARRLDTVAGFTAWRTIGILTIVGAVWGLFTATRLPAGRRTPGVGSSLLSGPTTKRTAGGRAIAGWRRVAGVRPVTVVVALAVAPAGRRLLGPGIGCSM